MREDDGDGIRKKSGQGRAARGRGGSEGAREKTLAVCGSAATTIATQPKKQTLSKQTNRKTNVKKVSSASLTLFVLPLHFAPPLPSSFSSPAYHKNNKWKREKVNKSNKSRAPEKMRKKPFRTLPNRPTSPRIPQQGNVSNIHRIIQAESNIIPLFLHSYHHHGAAKDVISLKFQRIHTNSFRYAIS